LICIKARPGRRCGLDDPGRSIIDARLGLRDDRAPQPRRMLDALQAAATFGFVIGALAFGLATALVFATRSRASPRELT